jgi:predicted Zn-dependent peptidase
LIHSTTLANGLTLIAEPQSWQPGVSFDLLIPAGAVNEPAEMRGVTSVLEDWMDRGAGVRDSRALSDAFDNLGVRRGGGAGLEGTSFSGAMLETDLAAAFALFADVVRRPQLPEIELEPCLELARQDIASLDDSPAQKLFVRLRERFFSSQHGRSGMGTLEGLAAITGDKARADYKQRFTPNGAILGVSGGVNWDVLLETVTDLFGTWTGETAAPVSPKMQGGFYEHIEQDTAQVQIGMLYPSLAPTDAQWLESRLALLVLSGAGFSSRLMQEVREKRGLVYSVRASGAPIKAASTISVYAGTSPDRAQETLDVIQQEMQKMQAGVTLEELERARIGLLTSLVMSEESSGARAGGLVRDWHLLGHARELEDLKAKVKAVTLEGVNAWLAANPFEHPGVMTLGPKALKP